MTLAEAIVYLEGVRALERNRKLIEAIDVVLTVVALPIEVPGRSRHLARGWERDG